MKSNFEYVDITEEIEIRQGESAVIIAHLYHNHKCLGSFRPGRNIELHPEADPEYITKCDANTGWRIYQLRAKEVCCED